MGCYTVSALTAVGKARAAISYLSVTCKVDLIIFEPTRTFCILHLVTDNEVDSELELTKNHWLQL